MKNTTINISEDSALVLFDWLVRFNELPDRQFVDRAEERALYDLEAVLETSLAQPFSPDYDSLLSEARDRICDDI